MSPEIVTAPLTTCLTIAILFVASVSTQNRPRACLQPFKFGSCEMPVVRYYYDPVMDSCRVFLYNGCEGNDNRFDDREQCTRICNAGPEQPIGNDLNVIGNTFNDDPSAGVCLLPADPGTCTDTNLIQYYYDGVTDSCRLFVYGGCGGNANRFRTKLTCQVACGGTNEPPPTQPPTQPPITFRTFRRPFRRRSTTFRPPIFTRPLPRITLPPRDNFCRVPARELSLKTFNYRSSFFHIFPQISITCPGVVRAWRFIPRISEIDGMYLAVLRARPPGTPNATAYTMVGRTSIFGVTAPVNVWYNYPVPLDKQFAVQAGDVLSLFYETWDYTNDNSVVALADKYSSDYDNLKSSLDLLAHIQQRGRESVIYDMNFQGYVDTTLSVRAFRYPALQIAIDRTGQLPTQPTRPNTLPQGSFTRAPPPINTGAGQSPDCLAEFQTSQTCLDNALRGGVDSRIFKARWFFDNTVKMCAMFWWVPDCYRSRNLFETEQQCRATCFGYMATTRQPGF